MCVVSMVMDYGRTAPEEWFTNPVWVKDFEDQMQKAKEIDDFTGQPDCENDEKKEAIQKIADAMGIKIEFPE